MIKMDNLYFQLVENAALGLAACVNAKKQDPSLLKRITFIALSVLLAVASTASALAQSPLIVPIAFAGLTLIVLACTIKFVYAHYKMSEKLLWKPAYRSILEGKWSEGLKALSLALKPEYRQMSRAEWDNMSQHPPELIMDEKYWSGFEIQYPDRKLLGIDSREDCYKFFAGFYARTLFFSQLGKRPADRDPILIDWLRGGTTSPASYFIKHFDFPDNPDKIEQPNAHMLYSRLILSLLPYCSDAKTEIKDLHAYINLIFNLKSEIDLPDDFHLLFDDLKKCTSKLQMLQRIERNQESLDAMLNNIPTIKQFYYG